MTITKEQFNALAILFAHYNRVLFHNDLPQILVTIARNIRCVGYFAPDRWREGEDGEGSKGIHEIALTAEGLARPEIRWHSTLVHEMVHLWVEVFGKRARSGYHTRQWGAKMKEVGLYPSATGQIGGMETGRKMTHYIIPGGKFEKAFSKIEEKFIKKLQLPYMPMYRMPEPVSSPSGAPQVVSFGGKKCTYKCICNNRVWGKPGLSIQCNTCKTDFVRQ